MSLALKRLLSLLLSLSLLALVGGVIGLKLGAPVLGTWAGALLGAAWAGWRDARRAGRLMRWMRGNMEAEAPRDGELWGELAYRTERALLQPLFAHAGQPTELHLFAEGKHGFGIRGAKGLPAAEWPQLAMNWIASLP